VVEEYVCRNGAGKYLAGLLTDTSFSPGEGPVPGPDKQKVFMFEFRCWRVLTCLWLIMCAGSLQAGPGSVPSEFGLSPIEVSTARSYAPFAQGAQASYFNPAGLSIDPENSMALGSVYASPGLKIQSRGGKEPAFRTSPSSNTGENNMVMLGLELDLSNLTTFDVPVGFGLQMGIDGGGRDLLQIQDTVSDAGQPAFFGKKPLVIASGIGIGVYRGIYLGLGGVISLTARAPIKLRTTLGGETSEQEIMVTGDTRGSPIFGLRLEPSEWFNEDNFFSDFSLALSWRNHSYFALEMDASADVEIQSTTLTSVPLAVKSLDGYVPAQYELGIMYRLPWKIELAGSFEFQNWKRLNSLISERSDVSNQSDIEFRNIVVPSAGVTYSGLAKHTGLEFFEGLKLRGGYSYKRSPLKSEITPGVNLLDADRFILATGLSWTFSVPGMTNPVSVDLAYQKHQLKSRNTSIAPPYDGPPIFAVPDVVERVSLSGQVNAFAVSATLRF
tara:strand:+ start:17714 stop:19210 length:1497 start_codon:yes stop_codon:yes gene_type:complete